MSSINTSSDNALYLAYRSVGPSADLIVPAVAIYLVALVGIGLNGTVLVVTAKSNSLRGSANFLMALICLCELVHQIGHTFFLVVVISGTNFVSLLTADLIMTPMIFALNCGLMAMFCAAFDRLFAVISPHNPTTGMVAETLLGPVRDKFFAGTFFISLCSTCCYLAIFVIIRRKNGVTQQTNTRVLRSLSIILSINIGGYLINLSIYFFIDAFGSLFGSPIRAWQFSFIAGILLNASAGSNAIVLYFNSTEYRQVFKKEFGALFGRFRKNNVIKNRGATFEDLTFEDPTFEDPTFEDPTFEDLTFEDPTFADIPDI
ncbi:hypothetical protein niasHT_024633 [Heterodera trifolii]|uniref:G-protein coupled receptors family 1 profile domain-containing protein n=1 Tax=Heterodera trifolii TaxID=157864 RepID=A0ABD2K7Q2_9BILA